MMRWLALLPCWLVVNLLAYLLAPVLPLFARQAFGSLDNGNGFGVGQRLPVWLAWFDTPDNPLTGDAGHRERTAQTSEYWAMVLWLWRNPAVGFDSSVLNANLTGYDSCDYSGDPQVQDAPHGKAGYCHTTVGDYWSLVYVKRIGSRCLKIDIGWQLKTFAEQPERILTQTSARYVLSVRFPIFKT